MSLLAPIIVFGSFLCLLFSWLIYVPIFMRMLKRFSENEFNQAKKRYWFFGKSVGFMFWYFATRRYYHIPDRTIRRHGNIIALMLCAPPIIVTILYLAELAFSS